MASCFRRIIWEFYHLEIRLTDLWMVDRWLGGLAHTAFMVCNSYRRKRCVFLFVRGICKKGQPCSCISEMLSQNWPHRKDLETPLHGITVASLVRPHLHGLRCPLPSDQGMVPPPRQCRSQWAFGTICCARWCGSAFAQQPGHFGVLARTMNKFLMSWSLISMVVFHAACAFDTIYSHFLFGSLSLSLCAYISQHMFLTQTDGSFRSINRAFENAPYISLIFVRLFFWCFVRTW